MNDPVSAVSFVALVSADIWVTMHNLLILASAL
jgi:hypothetical protein